MASYGLVLPEVFPKGTLITDIKQIVTSTDDNGENVFHVELFNGKKVEFKIRNGSKGSPGEKGEKGDKGDRGIQGEKGEQGIQGERGLKGDDGASLIGVKQTTQATGDGSENVIEFTLADGNKSIVKILNGSKGEKGAQGIQGVKGDRGVQGVKGDKGDRGIQGVKGDKGDAGKWDGKVPINPNPLPTAEGSIWIA